jgi:hypothetical protein
MTHKGQILVRASSICAEHGLLISGGGQQVNTRCNGIKVSTVHPSVDKMSVKLFRLDALKANGVRALYLH